MGESVREIDVVLTEMELEEKRRLLPLRVIDVRETREAAKAVKKDWDERIKGFEKETFALADAIKTGRERRAVPVFERKNEQLFRIETVREDNGEVIDVRAMDVEEIERARQPDLPFDRADDDGGIEADEDDGDDQRIETNTLPKHEALETIRAPARTMACPGPEGGEGCSGNDCSRCLGQCVIPTDVASAVEDDESERNVSEHEDDPRTSIESPDAVLNASARKDH